MLFLWVFGNAICAKVGNLIFPVFYILLGLLAATVHNLAGGGTAVGASGAINGVVGAFLVFYPLNNVSCGFFLGFRFITFSISSMWMILFWLAFDIWGAVEGGGRVGYFAHLGGFAAGSGLSVLALKLDWLKMERDERSLLDVLRHGRAPKRFSTEWRKETPPEHWTAAPEEPTDRRTMLETMNESRAGEAAPEPAPPRPPAATRNVPRPPTPPPAAQADTVLMKCVCGRRLRVPRSLSGRQARCPACSQIVQIPEL
jgi:hypothetical protein